MDILPAIMTPGAEWKSEWKYNKGISVGLWKLVRNIDIYVWIYDLVNEWHIVFRVGAEDLDKSELKDIRDAMLYAETRLLLLINT